MNNFTFIRNMIGIAKNIFLRNVFIQITRRYTFCTRLRFCTRGIVLYEIPCKIRIKKHDNECDKDNFGRIILDTGANKNNSKAIES